MSVLVLSGSMRAKSVTDAVGRHVAAELAQAGIETKLISVRDLALPMFDPDLHTSKAPPAIAALFADVRAARAMVWCTPGYHRTMSGSFKNVLDYFELTRTDNPSYLTGKAVGIVAVSGGIPASVSAITSLEFAAHALRAYVIPYTVPVPFADKLLNPDGKVADAGVCARLGLLVQEVAAFLANYTERVSRPSVAHGPAVRRSLRQQALPGDHGQNEIKSSARPDMKKVREFATGWGNDYPMTWSNRVEEELVGAAKGHLLIPLFRPFDFLDAPNKELTFLASDQTRIGVEALRGTEPHFHRNCDFDQVYFQWAGTTAYETESGVTEMRPAELMLVPAGMSHRATGSADSLRLSIKVRDPVEPVLTEKDHIGETAYRVTWNGGPDWLAPRDGATHGNGKVVELIHTWDDKQGEVTTVQRAYEQLVNVSTGGRAVQKLRTFDIFKEVTGRKGPGPILMRNDDFLIECYNTDGEQFAFHRGNRNEEFQFQFFGTADNICEFGTEKMSPGDLFIVRRGIAHRVVGSANFRRLVIYSKQRWDLGIDPTRPLRRTRFDVSETVVTAAPWRSELLAAAGQPRG